MLPASNDVCSVHKEDIESLPMELLTKVLKELEWHDILRVRQASRQLYEASKARDLWLHLFRLYTSTSSIPPRLETPIEDYSQDDLEAWLLRRIGADIGWKQDAERPNFDRVISNNVSEVLHLIEGGRWLLGVTCDGPVISYDLDAPGDIKPEILIPLEQVLPSQYSPDFVHSAVDMLPEPPNLSFNLAFGRQGFGPHAVISIFNITLVGIGRSAKLKATSMLSHTFDNNNLRIKNIDLSGTYLAICSSEYGGPSYVNITDWMKMEGTDYPRRTMRTSGLPRIHLLPDGRVLSFWGRTVNITSYNANKLVTSAGDESHPFDPECNLSIGFASLHQLSISTHTFDPTSGSFSFILANGTHIKRLVVPPSHDESPYLCPIMPYDNTSVNDIKCALGKHRGLSYPLDRFEAPLTHLLSYSSNILQNNSRGNNDRHLAKVGHLGTPEGLNLVLVFHEATGRVALRTLRHDGEHILILDFGIYPPPGLY